MSLKPKANKLTLLRVLPYILIVAGIIGFLSSSFTLVDDIKILKDPSYVPSCNMNPVISCGTVMQSKQANAFGFPNVIIGFMSYTVLITIGVAMLAGAHFKRWFWLGLQAGLLFGVGFVLWLFFQTVYNIHSLCPFCIVDWITTITTFWYVLLFNIDQGHIKLRKGKTTRIYTALRGQHFGLLLSWYLIMAGLILKQFWYYYGHYFQ